MAEAAINLGVFGLDWSDDGAGMTFIGLRIGGSRTRGLELGFNPGLGIEVNNKGIGCGVRADIGIRDGVSAGASAHAGFAIFRAEITGVVGWDQSAGTWGTAYADAFNALESPEVHQARVCELRRRLFAAWQQHLESEPGALAIKYGEREFKRFAHKPVPTRLLAWKGRAPTAAIREQLRASVAPPGACTVLASAQIAGCYQSRLHFARSLDARTLEWAGFEDPS
eukprot:CAMPEP_0171095228 /NCGR_PEP_ID=MMETSP0766_2-20121228/43056_1 /TAXON_ID=439317 /ORGANISM="Gambierdiscus australes, Strain CAWD 149" /LENGTH=224 /DNA_ID=CAMNT_0011554013 /DNA_START=73 /DNA_END=745 /DNA_ORIENTATION=+